MVTALARAACCVGQVHVSGHAACPFGAVASVHAWERVGAAITHVARVYLKLPVLRYVDDFFSVERFARASWLRRPTLMSHERVAAAAGGRQWHIPLSA